MPSSPRSLRATVNVVLAAVLSVSFGCADPVHAPELPTHPNLAKAAKPASGPSVSAATPPYGRQGETGEEVTITGSGFAPGAVATWSRGGDTTKVVVTNTQFVSSTQLVATIDIAHDAELAFYDIAVTNLDRKKGIGTEMFEVTTGLDLGSLGGNTNANAVSDDGAAVGYSVTSSAQHAFYWSETTGIIDIGGTNALGIDRAGMTIVGNGGGLPLVWTGAAASWTSAVLPISAGASGGGATSVASDPVTGVATIIGGSETIKVKHASLSRPRLWRWTGTSWQLDSLPMPYAEISGTSSWVGAVNASGQATGAVRPGGRDPEAVVWEADGSFTVLGPGGAPGINAAGTAIAGFAYTNTGGGPRYYWRNAVGDAWSGPVILPGDCWDVTGMDDAGRIIARSCPIPGSSRTTGGIFEPPYTSPPALLPGLGDLTEGGVVYGISPNGKYIVGTAKTKPTRVAVRWMNPLVP
jgi:probable HAF family extracellular repeat protein